MESRLMNKIKDLSEKIENLEQTLVYTQKRVLTSQEAARYMGVSLSYLYKLTMMQEIPHSKPMGKMVYFDREELEEWLMSKKIGG